MSNGQCVKSDIAARFTGVYSCARIKTEGFGALDQPAFNAATVAPGNGDVADKQATCGCRLPFQ